MSSNEPEYRGPFGALPQNQVDKANQLLSTVLGLDQIGTTHLGQFQAEEKGKVRGIWERFRAELQFAGDFCSYYQEIGSLNNRLWFLDTFLAFLDSFVDQTVDGDEIALEEAKTTHTEHAKHAEKIFKLLEPAFIRISQLKKATPATDYAPIEELTLAISFRQLKNPNSRVCQKLLQIFTTQKERDVLKLTQPLRQMSKLLGQNIDLDNRRAIDSVKMALIDCAKFFCRFESDQKGKLPSVARSALAHLGKQEIYVNNLLDLLGERTHGRDDRHQTDILVDHGCQVVREISDTSMDETLSVNAGRLMAEIARNREKVPSSLIARWGGDSNAMRAMCDQFSAPQPGYYYEPGYVRSIIPMLIDNEGDDNLVIVGSPVIEKYLSTLVNLSLDKSIYPDDKRQLNSIIIELILGIAQSYFNEFQDRSRQELIGLQLKNRQSGMSDDQIMSFQNRNVTPSHTSVFSKGALMVGCN